MRRTLLLQIDKIVFLSQGKPKSTVRVTGFVSEGLIERTCTKGMLYFNISRNQTIISEIYYKCNMYKFCHLSQSLSPLYNGSVMNIMEIDHNYHITYMTHAFCVMHKVVIHFPGKHMFSLV